MDDDNDLKLPDHDKRWAGSSTLAESVYRLVERKLTHTTEFKKLVAFYGKDKLRKIYADERARRGAPSQDARRLGEKEDDG